MKGSAMFVSAKWGLIPSWQKEAGSRRPPSINARSGTNATSGMFKRAYASRRCLIPIDGYFEWRDIHGTGKDKQPYAIAMKDGSPLRAGRHLRHLAQPCHRRIGTDLLRRHLSAERTDGDDP